MSCWFMGTGSFASLCLSRIVELGLIPKLVVTMPPRRGGRRGLAETPTPVDVLATERSLNVHRSIDVNSDRTLLDRMESDGPSVIFVIDFGQKVGEPYLSIPEYGCLNVHPSALPLYRGAAPVQRAIMDGAKQTGVTVFRLVEKMDAGPILISQSIEIDSEETGGELLFRLAYIGGDLLNRGVHLLKEKGISLQDQDHLKATYAHKIDKAEALLSWEMSAVAFHNTTRALNPTPGAFTFFRDKRLKIWRTTLTEKDLDDVVGAVRIDEEGFPVVRCSSGSVKLMEVQPEGRRTIDGKDWFKGSHLSEGDLLL
ncbi:methionyl-tRNA formyltransferase [Dethiosulfovibrio sp. F2B]|uniref:methionyl-tRNA formyltransferase n=1 Tax=Dethiosulfovibrio faecalis TaxID=2720018 RepID=UPI001F026B3F|nr:methionyl-tRNA formyltransferase [Dethiosulfovibrio faecalis]MCF4150410.1 methionyl-tRNA formyltransferase [Dethiosulfovibrio faecalis]